MAYMRSTVWVCGADAFAQAGKKDDADRPSGFEDASENRSDEFECQYAEHDRYCRHVQQGERLDIEFSVRPLPARRLHVPFFLAQGFGRVLG